ncbi:MAG: hypothetical protein Kow0059_11320 [Candidatus Sumerlaeia bacterium]
MSRPVAQTARHFLSSNVMLAVVSLFIASVIWMISKLDEVETEILSAPVRLLNAPANCEVRVEPVSLEVRLQYQRPYKDKVHPGNVWISLNLFGDESIADINDFKTTRFTVTLQNVKVNEGADLIRPIEILGDGSVNLKAMKYTEPARVVADVRGEPAPGFVRGEVSVEPAQVRLTGPPAVLEQLKKEFNGDIIVKTEPVNIEGARQNVFEVCGLIPYPDTKPANPDAAQIQVNVQITERVARRTIRGVTVEYRPFKLGLAARCTPSSATITVEAPLTILEDLKPADFRLKPRQFLTEEAGSRETVAIEATFADAVPPARREKVTIVGVEPAAVEVEIYKQ